MNAHLFVCVWESICMMVCMWPQCTWNMCFYGTSYESSGSCSCRSGAVFAYDLRRRVQIGISIHTAFYARSIFFPLFLFVVCGCCSVSLPSSLFLLWPLCIVIFARYFRLFHLYKFFSLILSGYQIVYKYNIVCVSVWCMLVEWRIQTKAKYESSSQHNHEYISEC